MNEFQYQQPKQNADTPPEAQPVISEAERRRRVRQANIGKRYCRNCGAEIQAGASVCIHCNTVLNPVAVRRAQEIVLDRKATVTRKELWTSFLSPKKGMKLYKQYAKRRPQVANPCRKMAIAGRITRWAIAAVLLLGFFGGMFFG